MIYGVFLDESTKYVLTHLILYDILNCNILLISSIN